MRRLLGLRCLQCVMQGFASGSDSIDLQTHSKNLHLCIKQTLLSKATYNAFRLYMFCQRVCSLGIEPTTFALLTQCPNPEPQEHRNRIGYKNENRSEKRIEDK